MTLGMTWPSEIEAARAPECPASSTSPVVLPNEYREDILHSQIKGWDLKLLKYQLGHFFPLAF